jgi:acyl-CoA synthetase (AMP-forming)/AMP-acid ligase II
MSLPFNLGDLIDRGRDPDKLALVDLGGEAGMRQFTFAELDAMANGVARALLARGLSRGDRVAILSNNRTEYLAAQYGAMRAGLVGVPVNHRFPREQIGFVLRDAGARLLFCDAERLRHRPADLPVVVFGAEDANGFDAFLDRGPFHAVTPAPDEVAMFLYTSGSTGRPKGVVLSHQSHLWTVRTRMEGQDLARHRYLIAAPLYHMNALALSYLACGAHATIVLLPQFTSAAYIDAIGRYRATFLTAVPPMIAMMLRERELLERTDLSSVEYLRMGSAPASPTLLAAIAAAMPHTKIIHAYGTTEGGPVVFGQHPDGLAQPPSSVGYPHRRVQVRLVDGDDRGAVQGVLEMKSPALMSGYHNRPDLSARFTPDGFYVTGDVFRRDEHGFHYFVGRVDDMFVCGGENIYPGEVEKLLETHPDIVQASVVPVDDAIKGQKPVAFCVARPGTTATEATVRAYALEHGPAYAHPRRIWFVDRLPLGVTGKIDRKGIAAMARERIAAIDRDSLAAHAKDATSSAVPRRSDVPP